MDAAICGRRVGRISIWQVSLLLMRKGLTFVVCAFLFATGCSEEERPAILWSFEQASISGDGASIVIDAYLPPDPNCYEFDRVAVEPVGEELVVSLFYLGPGDEQFCIIPCPLGTERLDLPLGEPQNPDLAIVKHPDTEPHCSETLP